MTVPFKPFNKRERLMDDVIREAESAAEALKNTPAGRAVEGGIEGAKKLGKGFAKNVLGLDGGD